MRKQYRRNVTRNQRRSSSIPPDIVGRVLAQFQRIIDSHHSNILYRRDLDVLDKVLRDFGGKEAILLAIYILHLHWAGE